MLGGDFLQLYEALTEIKKCCVPELEDYSTLQIITEEDFFILLRLGRYKKMNKVALFYFRHQAQWVRLHLLSILRMNTVHYIGISLLPNLEEEHLLEK